MWRCNASLTSCGSRLDSVFMWLWMRDDAESRADLLAERCLSLLCGLDRRFGPQDVCHEYVDGSLAIHKIGKFCFTFVLSVWLCDFYDTHTHTWYVVIVRSLQVLKREQRSVGRESPKEHCQNKRPGESKPAYNERLRCAHLSWAAATHENGGVYLTHKVKFN